MEEDTLPFLFPLIYKRCYVVSKEDHVGFALEHQEEKEF